MAPYSGASLPPASYQFLVKTASNGNSIPKAQPVSKKVKLLPSTIVLPEECEALKQQIYKVHPEKTMRFSLSAMKRVAIPPVEIPDTFTDKPTVVAGKPVLFTRRSWQRRKHDLKLMRRIHENDVLR
ncbi:hypothetical protein FI667_g3336, partial [Globisporangium splendens]